MAEEIYCPLQVAAFLIATRELQNPSFNCVREKCAWWNKKDELCAVAHIASSLSTLALFKK